MLLESKEHGSSDDNDFISDWINSQPVPFVKNVKNAPLSGRIMQIFMSSVNRFYFLSWRDKVNRISNSLNGLKLPNESSLFRQIKSSLFAKKINHCSHFQLVVNGRML